MAFYGAIEQVLTGWIFGLLDGGRRRATSGPRPTSSRPSAAASSAPRDRIDSAAMTDNDMVKRLVWSGLLAGIGALASIATTRRRAR